MLRSSVPVQVLHKEFCKADASCRFEPPVLEVLDSSPVEASDLLACRLSDEDARALGSWCLDGATIASHALALAVEERDARLAALTGAQ